MKECEGDGSCAAQADAECLACLLQLSEIEMKALGRFLDGHKEAMRTAGLSSNTIQWLVDSATI